MGTGPFPGGRREGARLQEERILRGENMDLFTGAIVCAILSVAVNPPEE